MHLRENTADGRSYRSVFERDTYRLDEIRHEVKMVIDGGGHIGSFTLAVKTRWPDAQVITVEPWSENIAMLEKNIGHLDGVTIVHGALGDPSRGTAKFLSPLTSNTGSGVLEGARTLRPGTHEHTEDVRVYSVGELCDAPIIDIMKLDCEGSEVEIITHLGYPLESVRTIVGETHSIPDLDTVHKLLKKTHVFKLSRNPDRHLREFRATRKLVTPHR